MEMIDSSVTLIVILLTLPLAGLAVVPLLRPLYRIAGTRFVFSVQGIEVNRLAPNAPDKLGISEITLSFNSRIEQTITYSYKRLIKGAPKTTILIGDEIELFALPWLTKQCGWTPLTTFTHNKALNSSPAIYFPFWFLGVLPLTSATYHWALERNLIFDLIAWCCSS